MSAKPDHGEIDVVVVTWNGAALLRSCLEHLARQTVPHRVIVVDNASTDDTVAMLAREFPAVDVIQNAENVGFGRANNDGVAAGTAPYVVLVNNDVDAEPAFLAEVVAPLRGDARCGAVTALTLRPRDGMVDQFGISLDRGLGAYPRCAGEDPASIAPGPLGAPCAGAAAYRRTAWEQVGGFDRRLFAYSEDLDLGLRLHAAGWTFASAPAARGVHFGGATTGRDSDRKRRLAAFGRGFVAGRHRPPTRAGLLQSLLVDLAVIGFGIVRHRTLAQLTGRARGLRAARGAAPIVAAPELIDPAITLGVALRRLAGG